MEQGKQKAGLHSCGMRAGACRCTLLAYARLLMQQNRVQTLLLGNPAAAADAGLLGNHVRHAEGVAYQDGAQRSD
jgi:hypothetical protein